MRHRTLKRALAGCSSVAALVLALALGTHWLTFVTTHGVSMLPNFHTGDLAVLHRASSYHVGEIVTYWSPLLHTTVMHRIHAYSNGLYTFKGDNNDFLDPVKLPASYIRGVLLFHIPKIGSLVSWALQPLHISLILAFFGGLAALGTSKRVRSSSVRKPAPVIVDPDALVGRKRTSLSGLRTGIWPVVAGSVAAALFLAFTIAAFESQPARAATPSVAYSSSVDFSYAAFTTPNAAYPNGSVTSPSPIYLKLVPNLTLRATYALNSTAPAHVDGTIALTAKMTETDGWSRIIATTPPQSFTGSSTSLAINLPLASAEALAESAASATGIAAGDEALVVTAKVVTHGVLGNRAFTETVSPDLPFLMNQLEVSLIAGPSIASAATYPQLDATRTGVLKGAASEPAEFRMLGASLNPTVTRIFGLIGLFFALALTAAAGVRVVRRRSEDERTLHRVRGDLVMLRSDPSTTMEKVVEVASITAMANLAERLDVDLLEFRNGVEHLYCAIVGDILYRCRRIVAVPVEGADFLDACITGGLIAEERPPLEEPHDLFSGPAPEEPPSAPAILEEKPTGTTDHSPATLGFVPKDPYGARLSLVPDEPSTPAVGLDDLDAGGVAPMATEADLDNLFVFPDLSGHAHLGPVGEEGEHAAAPADPPIAADAEEADESAEEEVADVAVADDESAAVDTGLAADAVDQTAALDAIAEIVEGGTDALVAGDEFESGTSGDEDSERSGTEVEAAAVDTSGAPAGLEEFDALFNEIAQAEGPTTEEDVMERVEFEDDAYEERPRHHRVTADDLERLFGEEELAEVLR